MILLCANRAGPTRFVSFSAAIAFLAASVTATLADIGIAARYPGDKNISSDPDVILADDFESYTSTGQLTSSGKWSSVSGSGLALGSGTFAGSKSIEMTLPIDTAEHLYEMRKNLATEQDVIYVRAYTKFDSGFDVETSSHNGLAVHAHYPGSSGVPAPPDGTGFFTAALQNNATERPLTGENQPGYYQVYAYWPKQRDVYGDHWFSDGWVKPYGAGDWLNSPSQYPNFVARPRHQPNRGQWYCYEIMVKANTINPNGTYNRDGEVKWWIDGVLDGDITDLFLRSIASLKIDMISFRLHAAHSERVNKKWYDNVVIAKSYIGPMATATPSPTPTATPTPTPHQHQLQRQHQRQPRRQIQLQHQRHHLRQRQPRVQP